MVRGRRMIASTLDAQLHNDQDEETFGRKDAVRVAQMDKKGSTGLRV